MTEFNIGDRVKLVREDTACFISVGTEGTVVDPKDTGHGYEVPTALISWDRNWLTGIPGIQSTDISCIEKV